MFKIKKFCMLITLHLCVLYGSQNRQQLLPYTALTDFYNRGGECLQPVHIESLYNTDTIRL